MALVLLGPIIAFLVVIGAEMLCNVVHDAGRDSSLRRRRSGDWLDIGPL